MSSNNNSLSDGRYVPVHRRNSSCSTRPSSVSQPLVYTREALLALAPPSHTHGVDFNPNSPNGSATFSDSEPHLGWTKLNEAMRNFLRASCPEIAMNRKMRKSLEYHSIQHQRGHRNPSKEADSQRSRSRESSRQGSSSRPSSPVAAEELPPTPFHLAPAPKPNRTHQPPAATRAPAPTPTDAMKRARSPTPRRTRPANSRTRQSHFTQLHLNAAVLATGGEGNWRVRQPRAFIPPLPTVSISSA